ncbi:Hsp20/alpha crystallin family protein [Nocardioides sp.]|uniref:Hsp20/alpha crystallin family protein n=1 Tax=Nocardioides sp. TaxID=35761 RepID=UPI0027185DCF|nr:Hsp20/alpha crystallin family protein [Nocardioides sp.]MDO9458156.1 Hsp20/alpha crystallin family protein [Nocardioides sp.]
MATERRNPFEGVTDFVTELGRLRTLGVHGTEHGAEVSERTHASAWVPPTDILARGDDLVIRIELAGVDPSEIDIDFHHGSLTVSGTRAADDPDGGTEFYVRERFYGTFRRVIALPEGTEAADVTAEFDAGLVEISVRGAVRPRASTRIDLADRSQATARTVDVGGDPA